MSATAPFMPRISALLARTKADPLAQNHLGKGLGRRAARGATATLITQWTRFVLQTASTVVLARLLTPEDYGLVGMVAALLGAGDALWNLGLQTATMQRKHITQAQVSYFFWLQASLGALLTAASCACAPLVVGFYGKPALYPIIYVYSFVFLLGGLLAQHRAVLFRQMRFTLVAIIDVVALGIGSGAAVAVAVVGGTYWAIVVQTVVMLFVQAVWFWYASGWRPSRPRREGGMWPLLSFGINLSLTNLLGDVGQNADNILVGKVYGTAPLGIYSRAYNLLLLPIRQIQAPMARVAVPVLSYLQDQPERFRRYYHASASALCYLAMPLMTMLAALSPQVVDILLGHRWHAVAPVFGILAIAGVLQMLRGPNSWIFTATNHTGRQAAWALISQPIRIGSFFIGIHWGIKGVAWAFTISTLIVLIPAFMWAVHDTPLRLRDIWAAGYRPLTFSVIGFGVSLGVRDAMRSSGSWAILLTAIAASLLAMSVTLLLWPTARREILELHAMLVAGQVPKHAAVVTQRPAAVATPRNSDPAADADADAESAVANAKSEV
jgi:O-antigen/teichoic acid export membrane protein